MRAAERRCWSLGLSWSWLGRVWTPRRLTVSLPALAGAGAGFAGKHCGPDPRKRWGSKRKGAVMVHFRVFRRVVALLVAVGLFAVLVAGISADDGDEEAVAEVALKPTQVVADVPEEYDTLFQLHWGGGSLYQLKGRLATMGCMANTIWLYDNNKWNVYNQYNISHTNPVIQEFIQNYSELIPAGTLWADCYRMCEFTRTRPSSEWRWLYTGIEENTQDCLSYEYLRERNFYGALHTVSETTPCNDNFDLRVKQYVLPRLPHHPDVCIIRQQVSIENEITGYGINAQVLFVTLNSMPVIMINNGSNVYRNNKERDIISLQAEIHELCHINQIWQWVQSIHLDTYQVVYYWRYYFEDSPQSQEFRKLVEMTRFGHNSWRLPPDSVYRNIYAKNPAELSAELCSMYLIEKMGERSNYDYETYSGGKYWEVPIRDFDTSKYLTPEIVEWLETYMILPDISE